MWERSAERCSCPASGLEAIVTTNRSDSKSRNGPRYPARYSTGTDAGATRIPPSHGTGGTAEPLPSKITTPAPSATPSSAASLTFVAYGAPARPPPARLAPMVVTPVVSASSR